MTTAGDIQQQALDRMGADDWCGLRNGVWVPMSDPVPSDARPAWRDPWRGDNPPNWCVLPEGWEWDGDRRWFHYKRCVVRCFPFENDFSWRFLSPGSDESIHYDTAPDAFRAAQKWIEEQIAAGLVNQTGVVMLTEKAPKNAPGTFKDFIKETHA